MSEVKMLTAPVPNVPWQERPENLTGAPVRSPDLEIQ